MRSGIMLGLLALAAGASVASCASKKAAEPEAPSVEARCTMSNGDERGSCSVKAGASEADSAKQTIKAKTGS